MPRESLVYEVLIASPSDVTKERAVLEEVVRDWNSANSRSSGISLQARTWQLDAVPASGGRPQEIVNKQLVGKADILVAVFWTRLGTPTGEALSGTVEEIEQFRRQGKPVLLYFSEADIPHDHDAEQFRRLKDYRKSVESDTLYKTFRDVQDLRRQATRDLATVVNELAATPPEGGQEPARRTGQQVQPGILFSHSWIEPIRLKALAHLALLGKKGFFEGVVCFPPGVGRCRTLHELHVAAADFRLPEFAPLDEGKTEEKRLSRGIERENIGKQAEWYIYWMCQRNGELYSLASLPEEMRSPTGALSANSRALQTANFLVSAGMFYKTLGVAPELQFYVEIRHGGLLGRALKQMRYSGQDSYGPCAEDQVSSGPQQATLYDIERRPWQLLRKLAEPLFDIFGYPLPSESDCQLYGGLLLNGTKRVWELR